MKPSNVITMARTRVAPVTLDQAIPGFLARKRSRGARDNTLDAYGRDLRDFSEFADTHDCHLVGLITDRLVERWLDRMDQRGLARRTQARRLSTLRSFIAYARTEGLLNHQPAKDSQVRFRTARVIAPELGPLLALVECIPTDTPQNLRDRAMCRLALDGAVRISEVVGLDLNDPQRPAQSCIDMVRLMVHVIGKGGDTEAVGISVRTMQIVREWMAVRERMAAAHEPALFVSNRGHRMSRQQLHNRFKHWAAVYGLPHTTFHMLRHRRVGDVVETLGLDAGQHLARHANKSTTVNTYGAHAAEIVRHQLRQHCDLDTLAQRQGVQP